MSQPPPPNDPLKSAMLIRSSFGRTGHVARASKSYDDLEEHQDHYAALNMSSSVHGYAKIRPRNRQSQSQDMWAIKMEDSIVSPKYLFDHPVYASHGELDLGPYTRTSNTATAGLKKKCKNYRIAPNTINSKFVSPYSKVPIKISDHVHTTTSTTSPPQLLLRSEAASSRNMNFSPSQELLSFSQSSCEPHQVRGSRLVSPEDLEDDTYSNDDYVDMASDTPEEDEQSLTGHYKHYSDFAPQHSTFGTG